MSGSDSLGSAPGSPGPGLDDRAAGSLAAALGDAFGRLLAERCPPALVRRIEGGEDGAPLWQDIEASGFADALLPEAAGGAGLALADGHPLLAHCGQHTLPLPFAQTLLARPLLAAAGLAPPAGPLALAVAVDHGAGSSVPGDGGGQGRQGGRLRCANVPFGRVAAQVLVDLGEQALLLPVAAATREPGLHALDATLSWDAAALHAAPRCPGRHGLLTLQALAEATRIAGLLQNLLAHSLDYANQREQFGRPIGKFQAIQHQLAQLAEQVAAAGMAAQLACSAEPAESAGASPGPRWQPDRLRVAVAKARCSEAAALGAAIAHAVHGAIGFTAEFDLQLATRALHAARRSAGSEAYWQGVLGQALVDDHAGRVLDMIRRLADPLAAADAEMHP